MNITHFFTYFQQATEEKKFSVQISSILVQKDNKNFLIDTGFVNHKEIVYTLNKMQISALQIDYVLNTHIHLDHCGGNRYFRNAAIYLSEEDYFFQKDLMNSIVDAGNEQIEEIIQKFYPKFNQKQTKLFSRLAKEMSQLWEDDIVGNSEQIYFIEKDWPFDFIEPIESPGHSIQHYCFKIHTHPKPFLITGDALTTKAAFRLNKLDFPYCYDSNEYLKNQREIGKFIGVIVPGHDKPFDTETGGYIEAFDSENQDISQSEDDLLEQYLK